MAGKFGSLDTASPGIAFVITSSPLLAQNPAVPWALTMDMRILKFTGKGGVNVKDTFLESEGETCASHCCFTSACNFQIARRCLCRQAMGHLKLAAAGRYHGANRVIVGCKGT